MPSNALALFPVGNFNPFDVVGGMRNFSKEVHASTTNNIGCGSLHSAAWTRACDDLGMRGSISDCMVVVLVGSTWCCKCWISSVDAVRRESWIVVGGNYSFLFAIHSFDKLICSSLHGLDVRFQG